MEGIHGAHGMGGEDIAMEKLRELLLALGTLRGLVPEAPPTVLPLPPPPHDHDWIIPLALMVVAVVSMMSLVSYFVFRCSKCKGGDAAGGGDGEALTLDHECAIACLVLVLFVVCSLASFYYYYCFRAGCFGSGGAAPAAKAVAGTGRKFLMKSR